MNFSELTDAELLIYTRPMEEDTKVRMIVCIKCGRYFETKNKAGRQRCPECRAEAYEPHELPTGGVKRGHLIVR